MDTIFEASLSGATTNRRAADVLGIKKSIFVSSLRSDCFLGKRARRDRAAIELTAILDARAKGKLGRE